MKLKLEDQTPGPGAMVAALRWIGIVLGIGLVIWLLS